MRSSLINALVKLELAKRLKKTSKKYYLGFK